MKILHKNLYNITWASLLAGFGGRLVDVFIPLILIKSGLTIWQVCAFYAGYSVFKLLSNYPATTFIQKHGAKIGLILGYIFMALYLILLTGYVSYQSAWVLYLVPISMALMNSFLWNSMHLHISTAMDSKRKSRDLAMMSSLKRLFFIFAPLFGGIIASLGGQFALVGVASFIVILSVIPISMIRTKLYVKSYFKEKVKYSLKYAPKRDLAANFSFNIHSAVGDMFWPIYLAVALPNFESIGIITTVAAATAFVALFVAGKRGDEGGNKQVLMESTSLSSIGHLARFFAITPISIGLVSSFYEVALQYQSIPWTSLYYSHTKQRGIHYIMSMEIVGDIAYLTLWSVLGVIAYFSTDLLFTTAFIVAAFIAWGCLLMTGEHSLAQRPKASF